MAQAEFNLNIKKLKPFIDKQPQLEGLLPHELTITKIFMIGIRTKNTPLFNEISKKAPRNLNEICNIIIEFNNKYQNNPLFNLNPALRKAPYNSSKQTYIPTPILLPNLTRTDRPSQPKLPKKPRKTKPGRRRRKRSKHVNLIFALSLYVICVMYKEHK